MPIQTTDLPAAFRSGVPYGTKTGSALRSPMTHLADLATERRLLF